MRRNHTLLGIFTAVAMCSTMLPVASFAAAGEKLTVTNGDNQHTGNSEGYSYEIWLDNNPGASGSMTLGKGGAFDTEWSAEVSQGNFLARRGMTFDITKKASEYDNITLEYAADYSASQKGNSRLCVYGWFRNGASGDKVCEYYIIEDWVNWCPKPEGASKTVTIDGAEYEIFTIDHYGPTIKGGGNETFPQLFSIRKDKRTSGTITVSDHFKAWDAAGFPIYNLTEVALNVEGWESSGKANVSKLEMEVGGTPKPTETPSEQPTEAPTQAPTAAPPADGYYMKEDFENGAGVWTSRGETTSVASTNAGAAGNGLAVTGRTDNWHGAATSLSNSEYAPGTAYSFSVMAKQDAAASDTFKLTLQYQGSDGKEHYDTIAESDAAKGNWVQLANTSFTIPEGASQMILYVEADSKTNDFVIDDAVIATKGTKIAATSAATVSSKGDVDANGAVELKDLVALQKYLLGGKVTINGENADMNDDNAIDIYDMSLLKRALLGQSARQDEPVITPAPTEVTPEPTTPTETVVERREGYWYNTADVSWIDPSKPMVAFAFDDGPVAGGASSTASRIQNALSENKAHATFFYVGQNIAGKEDEIKRAQQLGFEIANHTWSHTDARTLDANSIQQEITSCAAKLTEITGQTDFLLRPPFLGVNDDLQRVAGTPLINCGFDSGDWNGATTQDMIDKFMNGAQNGSLNGKVILMHETYDSTAQAVEYLVPALQAQGYQIVSVSEMFKAKGVDLKNGQVYNGLS